MHGCSWRKESLCTSNYLLTGAAYWPTSANQVTQNRKQFFEVPVVPNTVDT